MKLKNLFQKDDDRAVSPVIGVILMVAITVILAAVIGTFVLGLGEDIETEVTAGVTISGSDTSNSRTVTWTSEGTANSVEIVNSSGDQGTISNVGGSQTVSTTGEYSAVAVGDDGKRTVVRTFTVA
jgi:flagellin-like protein